MKRFILALTYTLATLFTSPAFSAERISTADLIEGQATVKNYMKDKGHFEKNANGFASYADAAATSPVDGTGGAATVTCTRTATTPLAGEGSFLITKDGANRQGNGCSASFSIDSKDKARVLQISFDYLVASGTYADGDQTVWLYDVTNSRLIQPAGSSLLNVGLAQKQILTFQTSSDSTSYRLIFHTTSTSTSAYTVKIDDIQVSPQVFAFGSSSTEWISYTPTGSWVANSTYTGKWRRNGGDLEAQVYISLSGAPTATSLTIELPTGLTIDTSSLASAGAAFIEHVDSSVQINSGGGYAPGILRYSDTNTLGVGYFASTSADSAASIIAVSSTGPAVFASGDKISIYYKVPIVGWSSSQVLSSETDTRVVAEGLTTNAGQSVNNGATDKINLNEGLFSTHGGSDSVTNKRINILVPGYYSFQGAVTLNSGVSAARIITMIYKNGAAVAATYGAGNSVGTDTVGVTYLGRFNAGDYVELYVTNDTGSAYLVVNGEASTYLRGHLLSGPAQIAASETVAALYRTNTGTLTTAFNTTTYTTKVKDSHNAYSSGTYTIPVSGTYDISAGIGVAGTYALNTITKIAIFIDGTETYTKTIFSGGVVSAEYPSISVTSIPLLAGQAVTIRTYAGATGNSWGGIETGYFSINRVGNY